MQDGGRGSSISGYDSILDDADHHNDKSFDLGESHRGLDIEETEFPDYDLGAPMEPEYPEEELEDLNVDIELAAVNDLQGNMDDSMNDQHVGISTAQHKWHPHTVKVMKVLRQSLHDKVRNESLLQGCCDLESY
jgi:hypothetical protein